MQHNPSCSVCDGRKFEVISTKRYTKSAHEGKKILQRKLDILFDLWCPGALFIDISSAYCTRCGFVTNIPRPSMEDVERKYFFARVKTSDVCSTMENERKVYESLRAGILYRFLKKYLPTTRSGKVLDFGGGRGALLSEFVERGYTCDLVDYRDNQIQGVNKVADTLEGLGGSDRYDLVICSHVLEHLAAPLETLQGIKRVMKKGGKLYVEVPMEIWRGVRQNEPVTHVNYFTQSSLKVMLARAGFHINLCVLRGTRSTNGVSQLVVKSVCTLRDGIESYQLPGIAEVRKLLQPTILTILKRKWLLRFCVG